MISPARILAMETLMALGRATPFVQEVLDQRLEQRPLPPVDRRLATQLVYGALRRKGTLRALIKPFIQPEGRILEPHVECALHLGAFQLVMLRNIPPHAAVFESVELAAHFGSPRAKGLVNGVLRALAQRVTGETSNTPAADAVPLEKGIYRRLTQPLLPDPKAFPLEYLADAFSLPDWLAKRWIARNSHDECFRLGFWFAGPAPLTLRVQPLRTSRKALLDLLHQAGYEGEEGEHPQAIRLPEPVPIRLLPGYNEGWFTVQDETAMQVGTALNPKPGSRVLDLCAAPGGKSTHLAELMQDQGEIIACDIDQGRLQTVQSLAKRLGLTCIRTCLVRGNDRSSLPGGRFDAVLADVPCSNTGVLGRRPEARWRIKPRDLEELVELQRYLFNSSAERLRPGGILVYSTCSNEPEENQLLIQAGVKDFPWLRIESEHEAIPGQPADGGYRAVLRRV